MKIYEFKLVADRGQKVLIEEAIRTTQFIRNKCLKVWVDEGKKPKAVRMSVGRYDLNMLCKHLAEDFDFADKLNSMARQAAAERAWQAIARFYDNCKKGIKPAGYPRFQKDCRSIEYKTSGWKLSDDFKHLHLKDGHKIGWMKLLGGRYIDATLLPLIKRVKIIRRANQEYYAQFSIDVADQEFVPATGKSIGLDVGLESFYTDSNGVKVENPRKYRKAEKRLKRLQRRFSKKHKWSKNKIKAKKKLGKAHLKVSNQRKDFVVKTARCVVRSNDLVVIEDLKVRNMKKNPKLAKSISDAGWFMFRSALERYGRKYGRIVHAVNPAYTSQVCSGCGSLPGVKKKLSDRWHSCDCGCSLDRDHNAALNILTSGLSDLSTAGSAGIYACGDVASLPPGSDTSSVKVASMKQESPTL